MEAQNDRPKKLNMDEIGIEIVLPDHWLSFANAEKEAKQRPVQKYTSKQIQSKAKVSKMQLINWTQRGVIIPMVDAKGRGRRRVYSHQNLMEVMVCRELNRFSIESHNMKDALDWLRHKQWIFTFHVHDFPGDIKFWEEMKKISGLPFRKVPTDTDKKVAKMMEDGEIPKKLTRKHTVWEFLSLYARGIANLFLTLWIEMVASPEDQTQKNPILQAYLIESLEVHNVTNRSTSTILINLSEIKNEAEG